MCKSDFILFFKISTKLNDMRQMLIIIYRRVKSISSIFFSYAFKSTLVNCKLTNSQRIYETRSKKIGLGLENTLKIVYFFLLKHFFYRYLKIILNCRKLKFCTVWGIILFCNFTSFNLREMDKGHHSLIELLESMKG